MIIGDFVLINLLEKKSVKYFIAKVINNGDVEVSYLRTSTGGQSFYFPNSSDQDSLPLSDIELKLETLNNKGGPFYFREDTAFLPVN